MRTNPAIGVPEFQAWALTICNVGTWRCSLDEGYVRCDSVMADQFGLTESEAQHGIPFARLRGIIHPDDRHLFDRKNEHVRTAGGVIVTEYRIVPHPDVERWILIRGRYDPRQPNAVGITGHGISIDITATKADGRVREDGFYAASGSTGRAQNGLHDLADAAIAMSHAVDLAGADAVPGVREAVDIALRLIGHSLANRVTPDCLN